MSFIDHSMHDLPIPHVLSDNEQLQIPCQQVQRPHSAEIIKYQCHQGYDDLYSHRTSILKLCSFWWWRARYRYLNCQNFSWKLLKYLTDPSQLAAAQDPTKQRNINTERGDKNPVPLRPNNVPQRLADSDQGSEQGAVLANPLTPD